MCIALFTTAHPAYSLIILDNRDEYILRPTSRPHWWTHPTTGEQILSSRDLHRAEKGTWLGITKTGNFAVLTNYRESAADDVDQNISGLRSRGKVVNAWLGGLADDGIVSGVHKLVENDGVKGVGGFSITCGKLRRKNQGTAVVSNRAGNADDVPIVGKDRGETWALSNTTFNNPKEWPKTQKGRHLLEQTVDNAVSADLNQDQLIDSLFGILDDDTLPRLSSDATMADYMTQLRNSILIPLVGKEVHQKQWEDAMARGKGVWNPADQDTFVPEDNADASEQRPPFNTGMYGTQRQTIVLVDLDGNVTYVERALYDPNGNRLEKGEGDVVVRYTLEKWDE